MSILDKAKELSNRVADKTVEFSSDEVIASTIIKAVEKQEKVNAILKARGSNYRIGSLNLGMGIPPSVTFGIWRLSDTGAEESSKVETMVKKGPIAE
ncbi:hypothetical protein SAMN05421690_10042 [Nitrosomonas sp. Nm51]|uniref:hypothetical protein n=1 Tax=Nitrosomonas sp. Nm51 TaxID=133720 RepID=UPI0008CDAE6F|nr:hypothetical protein [Nitrosomonas sp. Nm51]SEQ93972.1 hypothetical protein SAMN05421690_10042 [Nitrosomonas sp. Nm51]